MILVGKRFFAKPTYEDWEAVGLAIRRVKMEEELRARVAELEAQVEKLEEDVENMYTFDQLMSVMRGAYYEGVNGGSLDTFQLIYYL